jgi:hypothetical protein
LVCLQSGSEQCSEQWSCVVSAGDVPSSATAGAALFAHVLCACSLSRVHAAADRPHRRGRAWHRPRHQCSLTLVQPRPRASVRRSRPCQRRSSSVVSSANSCPKRPTTSSLLGDAASNFPELAAISEQLAVFASSWMAQASTSRPLAALAIRAMEQASTRQPHSPRSSRQLSPTPSVLAEPTRDRSRRPLRRCQFVCSVSQFVYKVA